MCKATRGAAKRAVRVGSRWYVQRSAHLSQPSYVELVGIPVTLSSRSVALQVVRLSATRSGRPEGRPGPSPGPSSPCCCCRGPVPGMPGRPPDGKWPPAVAGPCAVPPRGPPSGPGEPQASGGVYASSTCMCTCNNPAGERGEQQVRRMDLCEGNSRQCHSGVRAWACVRGMTSGVCTHVCAWACGRWDVVTQ